MELKKIIPIGVIVGGVILLFVLLKKKVEKVANLIKNPGFEQADPISPEEPANWYRNGEDANHILTWDNISHSGKKSLAIDVNNSTKSWFSWRGEDIPVEPNTDYIVEYWYKTENLPPKTGAESGPEYIANGYPTRAMFEWSEFDGVNPDRIAAKCFQIPWIEGNTEWTKLFAFNKTGPTTVYVNPRLFLYSFSGTVWFDDLSMRKETLWTGLFPNPNAEYWDITSYEVPVNDVPIGWRASSPAQFQGIISQSTDAYEGKYSVRLQQTGAGEIWCGAERIHVEPGKTYEFSAYIKTISPTVQLFILRRDTWALVAGSNHSGSGQWEKLSVVMTAEDIAEDYRFGFRTMTGVGIEYLIDKAELKEVVI